MSRKIAMAVCGLLALACVSASAGEKYTIRLGFETPRTDSQFVGADHMAKVAAEKSGGRLDIKLFPDGVLGSAQAMLTQMRGGTLDIYLGGSGYFANMAETLNIVDIPFLFRGYKHVDKVLTGELGRTMLDQLEPFGMKGLAFFENGFRCLTNSRRPVTKASDVEGLKLRTLANPMHIEAWTLLGTNPVPMPLSELYTALETKTVEGQEHPLNVTYSAKLYEVQPHISVSNHTYTPLIIAMNLDKFNALPEELQKILIEAAEEGAAAQKKFIRDNIAEMVKEMAAFGCQIVPASDVDMQSFVDIIGEKTKAMYLKDFGGEVGEKWLQIIADEAVDD
ncbi:MAG: DctP family TRAP transporter solute-binding subunit [Planctomycetes bacterium]|nr:DctP family TRAP transporter solute-binding subunit [Planctomycetota bacterium]